MKTLKVFTGVGLGLTVTMKTRLESGRRIGFEFVEKRDDIDKINNPLSCDSLQREDGSMVVATRWCQS
ncbi:shikimate dehydrogenase [Sesbania bispinosa]|nr:shikimate dehydrogenase [Sesbania bispinosa]